MRKSLLIGLSLFLSAAASAEDVVLSPKVNLQQIQIEKLNTEAGKKVVENPSTPKLLEKKKQKKAPVNLMPVLEVYSIDNAVPTSAKEGNIIPVEVPKKQTEIPAGRNSIRNVKPKTAELKGYCEFTRGLKITTVSMPVELPCYFGDKTGTLYGELLPDFKTYSLIMVPKEVKIRGEMYRVKSGYVLSADRTTMNLADYVNKQLLKKVLYAGLSQGVSSGFSAYQKYIEDKYTQTQTVGTENPVIVQTHDYPPSYPYTSAVLGFIKGLTTALSDVVKQETDKVPVIFRVNGGKTVYVRLLVEEGK